MLKHGGQDEQSHHPGNEAVSSATAEIQPTGGTSSSSNGSSGGHEGSDTTGNQAAKRKSSQEGLWIGFGIIVRMPMHCGRYAFATLDTDQLSAGPSLRYSARQHHTCWIPASPDRLKNHDWGPDD